MHMATGMRRWTRADLQRLPDDTNRYEVVNGELFVTPAPSPSHQSIVRVLARHLSRFVEQHHLGEVHQSNSAVVLGENEVEPDLFVCPRAFPPPPRWDDMPLPFLVVEVLSPTTGRRDHIQKRALYADATIEYWIVDGSTRTIRVISPPGTERVESIELRWVPPGTTAYLDLDVAALFQEALG